MIITLISIIATAVLLFLSSHFNKQYKKAKEVLKQISHLLETIDYAIEDNKLTTEEIQQIIKQCKALIRDLEGKNVR